MAQTTRSGIAIEVGGEILPVIARKDRANSDGEIVLVLRNIEDQVEYVTWVRCTDGTVRWGHYYTNDELSAAIADFDSRS